MSGILLALLLVTTASRAMPQSSGPAVEAALARCLNASLSTIPKATDPQLSPPGLAEGVQTSVTPIDGTEGLAFYYEGTNPRIESCGIALYGKVSRATRESIASIISAKYHASADIGAWDLTKRSVEADEKYYGISLVGVAVLTRKPQHFAPTLEVNFHSILVQ